MNKNSCFIQNKFRKYYKENELFYPERFGRREFGFMFIDGFNMLRHISFKKRAEIKNFLYRNVPSHVYYSSAYYQKPNAKTMQEKIWLGADLIFDLDADHIKGAENMCYEEMLEKVKVEIKKLLNDFLLNDFGFDEKYIKIAFSGGRGYHIHVTDKKIFQLKSNERREIVDYIIGEGLNLDRVFIEERYAEKRYGRKIYVKQPRLKISSSKKGWTGRISRGILEIAKQLEKMNKEEALNYLREHKIGKRYAEGIYNDLFSGAKGKRGFDKLVRENEINIDVFSRNAHLDRFSKLAKDLAKVQTRGETDEPVTSDIKRLIRMPSSLHGKTGFKVVLLNIDELEDFFPLKDAVVFSDSPVKIEITKPTKISLKNEKFDLKEGINDIPEYLAVFLVCRNLGNIM